MVVKALVLVRHAESTWNVERRMQGHANPPLTEVGRAQAVALGKVVQEGSIDVVVSSDLERALETANAVAKALRLRVEVRQEWREHDMGTWTGLTREEIKEKWPLKYEQYRSGDRQMSPGGGESREVFRSRILKARERLDQDFPGSRVMVFTHRGAIRLLAPDVRPRHAELVRV